MPAAPRAITYIDTSVWCAYCFNEPEAPEAVRWLAEAELDRTATALWAHTEFASACGIKLRKAKGDGRTSEVLVDAGIRCHENRSRSPEFPAVYVASYAGAQAET